jgi:hypothetical protein
MFMMVGAKQVDDDYRTDTLAHLRCCVSSRVRRAMGICGDVAPQQLKCANRFTVAMRVGFKTGCAFHRALAIAPLATLLYS